MKSPDQTATYIDTASGGDGRTQLRLRGDWTIFNAAALERVVDQTLKTSAHRGFSLSSDGIERLDTAGAWQLRRLIEAGGERPALSQRQQALLDFLPDHFDHLAPPPKTGEFSRAMTDLGARVEHFLVFIYTILSFIGQVAIRFGHAMLHPRHLRLPSIVKHINDTGLKAMPIVGLLGILMSMVVAYQASLQLRKFGASIFTIDLTVISMLREMGVLITAIMVAGRSGSAFAAEIGVMKLREEVDALKTMGLDPIEILVLPRLIALLIALPVLTLFADLMGLVGGALMSVTLLDIPLDQYLQRASQVGTPTMFFVGMIKAPVFAFLISIIGTFQGMSVTGSAESVGSLTTVSVVQSIFMVIFADAFFSIVFAQMGI